MTRLRPYPVSRCTTLPCVQAATLPCVQVYDKKVDGPRFVFHTAFTDPASPPDAPPRRSIEVRAIAFYDPPPLVPTEDLGVPRDKICEAMKVGAR